MRRLSKTWADNHGGAPPVLQASLLCEAISWNLSGRITFHNEFDSLPAGEAREFFLVQVWRGSGAEHGPFREAVELIDPDGRTLVRVETEPFTLSGPTHRHVNYMRFSNTPLLVLGVHEFRVALYHGNSRVPIAQAEHPLLVI